VPLSRSHGKTRTELPRLRRLAPVPPPVERPSDGRDASGRFAKGNSGARNRAWKTPIAKLLGRDLADPVAARVSADAWHWFSATVRTLPSDGPIVRSLAAQVAHHVALAAWWSAQVFDRTLGTVPSVEAEERARIHGQRAERLSVTLLDVSTRLAKSDARPSPMLRDLSQRLKEIQRRDPDADDDDEPGARTEA
jgi:hypothetical protein